MENNHTSSSAFMRFSLDWVEFRFCQHLAPILKSACLSQHHSQKPRADLSMTSTRCLAWKVMGTRLWAGQNSRETVWQILKGSKTFSTLLGEMISDFGEGKQLNGALSPPCIFFCLNKTKGEQIQSLVTLRVGRTLVQGTFGQHNEQSIISLSNLRQLYNVYETTKTYLGKNMCCAHQKLYFNYFIYNKWSYFKCTLLRVEKQKWLANRSCLGRCLRSCRTCSGQLVSPDKIN